MNTAIRKDLRGIAKEVFHAAIYDRVEMTGVDLARSYSLNDPQLASVKRYVKEEAANNGCLWGYDDYLGRYRVCPDNDKQAAARMLKYAFRHWGRQGQSLKHLAIGAKKQGLINTRLANELQEVPLVSRRALDAVITKLTKILDSA